MTNLQRNYMVDENQILQTLKKDFMTKVQELDRTSDPDFYIKTARQQLAGDEADSFLQGLWGAKTRDGGDIRHKYQTYENFKETMLDRVVIEEDLSYVKKPTTTEEKPTQTDLKAQYSFQPVSSAHTYSAGTTTVLDEATYAGMKPKEQARAHRREDKGKDGGLPKIEKSKQYRLKQDKTYNINVETGGGITITADLDDAFNLTTGSTEELPKSVNKMKVLQVGTFNIAQQAIEISRVDQDPLIVPKGHPLPDRWDEDFDVTAGEWKVITDKTRPEEKAKVYASSNPLDLMEHMEMEEIMELITREGTTNKMLLVDYSEIHNLVAGVYGEATGKDYNAERNDYLNKSKKVTPQ
jgi:hypothetical protein